MHRVSNDLIDKLSRAKKQQYDTARADIVTRINTSGKMTARQRVDALLDADSAVEYGSIAAQTEEGEWIAEAGGVDFVGTIGSHPVITSSTDYTDHGGGYGAGRLGRLFALAYEHRWPLVLFVDGGGSRAQHPRAGLGHVELSGPIGRFSFLDGLPELSGWVPSVAIVSGPSFAGHASLAGFSDFLISTPGSAIGMGGPPMVEAALGQRMSPNELAGAEMHEHGGGIDLLVDDEIAAIGAAKQFLDFYHHRKTTSIPPAEVDLDTLSDDYDMHDVISGLVDANSFFELRPNYARNLITGFARIEGVTIGLLANQPRVRDGAIDHAAAIKISRFVEMCNTYEYPMVSLIDTPGCETSWQDKDDVRVLPGLTRWHTRVLLAHQQRTVPLMSVQLHRAGGLAGALMTGVSSTRGVPLIKLGWPNVDIGMRDGFAAVVDHDAFDDIIAPGETRERITRLIKLLDTSKPAPTNKKHRIDSW
ncbi:MAG: acetyl-CoA carboxylase carboxyltransferase component [Candidatus Azotimanducaceae bacterium]